MRLPLTPTEALAFLRAIETAATPDELSSLRKELRLRHGSEEWHEFLELMFNARALQLASAPSDARNRDRLAG